MKSNFKLIILFSILMCFKSISSLAYMDGVHFYLTYSIGYWCGLDDYPFDRHESEAYAIAWGNGATDAMQETSPGVNPEEWFDSSKPEIRRRFHFPVDQFGASVARGSSSAYRNIDCYFKIASRPRQELFAFGIGLHSLQDSWSHDGYGPEFGHAWTIAPDFPHNDPQRTIEMAEATWLALDHWMLKIHKKRCRTEFRDIEGIIRTWSEAYMYNQESLDETWKKNAEAISGKPIDREKYSQNKEWARMFLKSVDLLWTRTGSESCAL